MRFCVKFLLSKLRLRKFFDKYHVCLPLHSHGIFVYLCIWSVNHLSFFSDKDFLYWPRPPPYLTKSKKKNPIFYASPKSNTLFYNEMREGYLWTFISSKYLQSCLVFWYLIFGIWLSENFLDQMIKYQISISPRIFNKKSPVLAP